MISNHLRVFQGSKHRLGFRRKQSSAFTVHRSEEVAPTDVCHLVRQPSSGGQSSDEGSQGSEGLVGYQIRRL